MIVPVLNEADTIAEVVGAVPPDVIDEIVVVDGGSQDATVARAQAAGARVIVEPRAGYGAACIAGARATDRPLLAFMDGDGSDDAAELRNLVRPLLAGHYDFVIGSRTRGVREPGSMGLHQRVAGRITGLIIRALYGTAYTDMCPLRAIRRSALESLGMRERTYGWNLEMQMRAARARLRILELPVRHRRRAGGRSKVAGSVRGSLRASWQLASTLVRVAVARRPSRPYHDPAA